MYCRLPACLPHHTKPATMVLLCVCTVQQAHPYGMMISPSGSPERMGRGGGGPAGYRRAAGQVQWLVGGGTL